MVQIKLHLLAMWTIGIYTEVIYGKFNFKKSYFLDTNLFQISLAD